VRSPTIGSLLRNTTSYCLFRKLYHPQDVEACSFMNPASTQSAVRGSLLIICKVTESPFVFNKHSQASFIYVLRFPCLHFATPKSETTFPMHSALALTVLGLVSYAFATPVVTTVPKSIHLARETAPSNHVSQVQITHPAHPKITQPTHTVQPTCTPTITPDKNGYVPFGTCHVFYRYYPSLDAPVAFSVLLGILMTLHITQAIYYQKTFCWVISMAAIWEFGAFVTRALSTRNQQNTWLALIKQLLVLLAPLWVNAFDYMLFARMVHFYLPRRSLLGISAGTFGVVFVTLDIASSIVQFIGGLMGGPSATPDQQKKGINIYMGGIGMQEFFIIVFLGLVIKFHLESRKVGKAQTDRQGRR